MRKLLALLVLFTLAFAAVPAVQAFAEESEYYLEIDIANQCVTAYRTSDGSVVRQMICSTGLDTAPTPVGTYIMPEPEHSLERVPWKPNGNVYINYATRIVRGIHFHSVLYNRPNYSSVNTTSVRKMGQKASQGCIRLWDADAEWIAKQCPPGTVVYIFDDGSRNDYMRSVLMNVGSYTADIGLTYDQYICYSSDPDTLSRSSSGSAVAQLETRLRELGFFTGTPDGAYDTETIRAVVAFQKAAGLEETGLADRETRDLAASADAPAGTRLTLTVGMSSRSVRNLQAALKALKLYDGPLDGVYTQSVADAVRVLQSAGALTVNGAADQATQEAAIAMAEELAARFGDGDYALVQVEGAQNKARVISSGSSLRLRAEPSDTADVLAEMAPGTEVEVISRDGAWAQVRCGEQTGYCMAQYLSFFSSDKLYLAYGQDFLPEGDALKSVQQYMIELGYMEGTATGKYDLETIEAVKAFQQAIGQYPDGLPGEETLAQAGQADAPTGTRVALSQGDSGRPVEELQKALQALRLYAGEIDGEYDAEVAQAVALFESYYGYAQDGAAEPEVQADARARAQALRETFGGDDYDMIPLVTYDRLATVTVDALWLRAEPSTTAETWARLAKGERLDVLSQDGEWTQVRYGEQVGYVMSQYISVETTTTTTPQYGADIVSAGDVRALQSALISLGYMSGTPSGVYDDATFAAVQAFQQATGAEQTGLAGADTLAALEAEDAPAGVGVTLAEEQGTSSERAVVALKRALAALKLYDGDMDGAYDAELAEAVRKFEGYFGHAQDGVADPAVQKDIYDRARTLQERFGDGEYSAIPVTSQIRTATVTVDALWLRAEPSTTAETRDQLLKGEKLSVLEELGGWLRVSCDGMDGYVMSAYVSVSAQDASTLFYDTEELNEEEIAALQRELISLGYMNGAPTGRYDQATISAVKAFEQAAGDLYADGYANAATIEALRRKDAPAGFAATLTENSSATRAVEALQQALADLRFYAGEIDGVYDAQVAEAVKEYQRYYGGTVDGVADGGVQTDIRERAEEVRAQFGDDAYDMLLIVDSKTVSRVVRADWMYILPKTSANYLTWLDAGTEVIVLGTSGSWLHLECKLPGGDMFGYAKASIIRTATETTVTPQYGTDIIPNADVRALQEALISLGYLSGSATGNYDQATYEAVKAFQQATGELATGVASNATLNAAQSPDAPMAANTALRVGMRGAAVKELQASLQALGYYTGALDGNYTETVAASVKMYQRATERELSGIADKATQEAIHAAAEAVREQYGEDYVIISTQETVQTATVQGGRLRLREQPSASAATLCEIPEGTELAVLETLNGWLRVRHGEEEGYVMTQYVTLRTEVLVKPVYGKDLLGGAEAVRELQRNLIYLGYLEGEATGIYDTETLEAVKAFQEATGEEATGEATEATLEASREESAPAGMRVTLREGASGKAVEALQEALKALNFYAGEADGEYDAEVREAVELFQRYYRAEGFTASGEATPEVQQAAL